MSDVLFWDVTKEKGQKKVGMNEWSWVIIIIIIDYRIMLALLGFYACLTFRIGNDR